MKTASDYVAAAIAAADATPPAAETPVAPAAPVAVEPVEAAEAPAEAVEGSTVTEAAPGPVKAEAPKSVEAARAAKTLEDVAREKAALRAEREKFKQEQEGYAPAKSMAEAAKRRDAIGLLAAAGIPWSEAAEQVLNGGGPKAKAKTEEPEPDERDQRIARLEQEVSARKAGEIRQRMMTELQARTKANGDKYRRTSKLGEESRAVGYIEEYYNRFGELPGEDIEESMDIALEAVENLLAKEEKRWAPLLTSAKDGVTVPVSKSEVPAVGAVSQQAPKTLTNGSGAGPKAVPATPKKPKTEAEYQAAAIEALSNLP